MQLGVDFGTTRTVVAYADRGNYPVVPFTDTNGDYHEYFPSIVALDGDELVYGFAAQKAAENGAPYLRSFKRELASPHVTIHTTVHIGEREVRLLDLLTGFFDALRIAIETALPAEDKDDNHTIVVGVPAHAHGGQRFLTLEGFRRAGFDVLGMINEPSAAGFEYTHRRSATFNAKRNKVIVYDLGGGTFDASLAHVHGTDHEVLGSRGLNRLGGDDFDAVLANCAMQVAGIDRSDLDDQDYQALLNECRDAKERLYPQTKRVILDVADKSVIVPINDFYDAAAPLVESTIEAVEPFISSLPDGGDADDLAGIYLVGGGSSLPMVSRLLRDRFGRRVFRSPLPSASTAIGLAIAVDEEAGYSLTDRLSRGFGVFREQNDGQSLSFDEILDRNSPLRMRGRTTLTRQYQAVHNVGWFRFVEYTKMDDTGIPAGDIFPFAEIVFPFEPDLQNQVKNQNRALHNIPVERREWYPQIEETYQIDEHGIVEVKISDLSTGYTQIHAFESEEREPETTSYVS